MIHSLRKKNLKTVFFPFFPNVLSDLILLFLDERIKSVYSCPYCQTNGYLIFTKMGFMAKCYFCQSHYSQENYIVKGCYANYVPFTEKRVFGTENQEYTIAHLMKCKINFSYLVVYQNTEKQINKKNLQLVYKSNTNLGSVIFTTTFHASPQQDTILYQTHFEKSNLVKHLYLLGKTNLQKKECLFVRHQVHI